MGTIDLNHLSVFAAVAETASFTEAARRLGVPKSTVSRAIASLEAALGVRVLQRTTRTVALTTAGQALVSRLASPLQALTEAIAGIPELADEPSGSLRLTATADFGAEVLAEIMAGFCRRYPRISVAMHLSPRPVDLVKEGFDAAFRILGKKPRDSGLIARKVGELSLQFYASPEYLRVRGTPKALEDLSGHDGVMIVGTSPFAPDEEALMRARLQVRLTADDGFFAREALRHGMGIGLLPSFLAQQDVLAGKLVRVLPRWAAPTGGVFLVRPSGQHLPRKLLALRDHVVEALGRRFSLSGGEG
ncbi:LysR family transcriptional regulator [Chondromyces crocatus]|uniref:LysR family transcriptional regulator n=1 Tax=Chondromyces crocatus TaxID=52 RepID=A0A0K1EH86_CHOCO|nr:LysR family transcriptional regulator [Chondromyces crocatus]AKT40225.1 LysR family transcriptional regulator [Chondromyces crocatus]